MIEKVIMFGVLPLAKDELSGLNNFNVYGVQK